MPESRQEQSLSLEVLCDLCDLLLVQITLTHFFDSEESIAQLDILRLIDNSEAPLAYQFENAVALLEQEIGGKEFRERTGD
jgi:hypothetical protein